MRRLAFLAAAGAAGLAGAGSPGAGAGGDSGAAGRFLAVGRRTVAIQLVEFGEVESREVRSILAPISGEVTWVADEGALVKAGDPVLKINTESLEQTLEEDRKAGVGLEGNLATQKATATAVEKHRQAGVRKARLELELAKNALAEARSHPTPEEKKLAELEAAIQRAVQRPPPSSDGQS